MGTVWSTAECHATSDTPLRSGVAEDDKQGVTAPTYVNKAEYTWSTSSQAFTIPTVQDGDVGILISWGSTAAVSSHTHSNGAKRTAQTTLDVGAQTFVASTYDLLATDSAGTLTVTNTAAVHCGVLLVYRGVTGVNFQLSADSLTSARVPYTADDVMLLVGACYRSTAAVLESSTGTERSDLTNSTVELEVHEVTTSTTIDSIEETWTTTNTPSEIVTGMFRVCGTAATGHVYKGRASASDDTTGAA